MTRLLYPHELAHILNEFILNMLRWEIYQSSCNHWPLFWPHLWAMEMKQAPQHQGTTRPSKRTSLLMRHPAQLPSWLTIRISTSRRTWGHPWSVSGRCSLELRPTKCTHSNWLRRHSPSHMKCTLVSKEAAISTRMEEDRWFGRHRHTHSSHGLFHRHTRWSTTLISNQYRTCSTWSTLSPQGWTKPRKYHQPEAVANLTVWTTLWK